ncbi:DTW domain-containing protein [Pseudomaricurvus alkylphenolicus]|uniref:DTW domain-containing protein n=1 Tax=Pseudomaricurvus alkylphenolicus TaxID=1306991 RepID=UPI001420AD85|nr:DTW domain-containing protein [Pseudomaricurvus alkylphenolicus]
MLTCERCHLRQDLCLCQQAPRLSELPRITLLTHERELQKTTNTGRLLLATLPGAELMLWSRRETDRALSERAAQSGLQQVLLFPDKPSESQPAGHPVTCIQQPEPNREEYILLDATWQQAGKMLRQSRLLKTLPRLSLQTPQESVYHLRRNQQPGNLSTAETAIALLHNIRQPEDAVQLQQHFERFLHHYEAHRSHHPLTDST